MSAEGLSVKPDETASQASEEANRDSGPKDEEKKFERLRASRVYFVRQPKPAELSAASDLDKEKDAIDEKLRKISDELQPLMSERSRNSGQLAEAREAVRELKAKIEDKELILDPYRQERKALQQDREAQRRTREEQRTAERKAREEQFRTEQTAKQKIRNDFNSQYGHLGVSTDDEIDEKIRLLEFQQQHESLTIGEEKAVLKQIKRLQDSREAVRTYSQWSADDKAERETKAAQAKQRKAERDSNAPQEKAAREVEPTAEQRQDTQKEEMEELKRVLDGLWEDYKLQLDIKNRHQEMENSLKQKIEALLEKRDSRRKEREEVWANIQKHRNSVRSAHKPFSDNRSFSSHVRELVKRGKVDEACEKCAQQTDELMEQYASDATFRTEYNKLWDAAIGCQRPVPSASESHHNAAASVIAEALEAARRSVASKQARAKEVDGKPADLKLRNAKPEEAMPPAEPSTAVPASKPTTIPGMEESTRPKPKAKKEKKGPKLPAVEIPKLDDTPFVPPAVIREKEKSTVTLSAADLKEQERVHNRLAAEEAALRKERRRQAQEKKRKQKAQQRAEQQPHTIQAKEEVLEEVSAPETPPVEEVGFKPATNAAPEGLTAAVTEESSKLRSRSGKTSGKERKTTAPLPKPRPFARKTTMYGKLNSYSRQLYSTAEERPLFVCVSGLAAVALAVAPALYFYS